MEPFNLTWGIVAGILLGLAVLSVVAWLAVRPMRHRGRRAKRALPDGSRDDPPASRPGTMETLREAIARLERRGFDRAFQATADGQLRAEGEPPRPPEKLIVEETVRFEGESNPGDEAVLFALRSPDDRVRGTFVASYGTQMDPDCAAAIQRLGLDRSRDRAAGAAS